MPRGRPRVHDENKVLDAAMTVLWREGVRGVSLNRLAKEMGVSKPVIAAVAGSKDELIARALERYHAIYGREAARALEQARTPEELAGAYLSAFAEQQTAAGTPPGCFLATSNTDCSRIDSGPIRTSLDRVNEQSHSRLLAALKRVGAGEPETLARYLSGQGVAMSALARNGATNSELHQFAALAARACQSQ